MESPSPFLPRPPKVSFSLRTCPPGHIKRAAAAFDNTMRDALSDLASSPLSEWVWLKALLPSSRGGLNLRRASLHAPAAYISSLFQATRDLVAGIVGEFTSLQSTCRTPLLPLPLRLGDLSGRVWTRLTSPCTSVRSLTALMRPLSIISWLLCPMSATEP